MNTASTSGTGAAWRRPMMLLSIFGLSSLLGASKSAAASLGLGLAMIVALVTVNVVASLLPRTLPSAARTAAIVFTAGAAVGCIELLLNAFWHELYKSLGLFLPLIAVACLVIARPESELLDGKTRLAAVSALKMGSGFLAITLALGAARELVGHGSLFANADQLLGTWAKPLDHTFFRPDLGFVLAVLAPGAFIALGILMAIYHWIRDFSRRRKDTGKPL